MNRIRRADGKPMHDCSNEKPVVKVKRVDLDLPLPQYKTPGACGCDLYARVPEEGQFIGPHETVVIPCNVIVKIPEGYVGIVAGRSSLPLKTPLIVANGVGIIDQDFCGESDEIGIVVYNRSDKEYIVRRGDRLGQLLFVQMTRVLFEEVEHMDEESRGGYGSTGGYGTL
ncbi:MAG TPA: dUTP diphosphatase [Firmicutes bacterium]|nr:dUTP diphosphatase [Bacillota bacterium]